MTENSNANRFALAALAVVMLAGAATPAGAANATFNVGVDIAGVYQDVTRFSVVCRLTQNQNTANGRADGVQLLRDNVGGRYVGRWKDTLTITFAVRGTIRPDVAPGTFQCGLYLDDQNGTAGGAALQTIGGNFPIAYNYLGQFTYRGRAPSDYHGKLGGLNGATHFLKP